MTQLASAVISLGVKLLPRQERRRYAEELGADLQSRPPWGRLAYAVSIILGMPRLRWELLGRHSGQPVPFCFVGMHRNVTVHPNPEDAWLARASSGPLGPAARPSDAPWTFGVTEPLVPTW